MSGARIGFVGRQALGDYDLGPEHPLSPVTRARAVNLIRAYGLLDRPNVTEIAPRAATDEEIAGVHTEEYIAAVKRYDADPVEATALAAMEWGLAAWGDTPAFAGMHTAASEVCGSSLVAALSVWNGDVDMVFAPGGGLHHAFATRAAGFCIYNDPAVAIRALLDAGANRIAYVDVDVHHGDGTQWIFYDDPRVLTCSVHEDGRYLFPGTGGIEERGRDGGVGTSVNIPLPPFSGDTGYLRAIEEVIVPAVTAFGPEIIVTQNGVDPHHQDPLAHLQVTMDVYPRVWTILRELAAATTGGRLVALGGGGYNPDVLPRAWALLFADMVGADLDEDLPEAWLDEAREVVGPDVTTTLHGEGPFEAADEQRSAADEEAARVVERAKAELLA